MRKKEIEKTPLSRNFAVLSLNSWTVTRCDWSKGGAGIVKLLVWF